MKLIVRISRMMDKATSFLNPSSPEFPGSLGDFLINGVREIDLHCSAPIHGVEGGLSNIRIQFAAQALNELGKSLTEETLTSWLLCKQLRAHNLNVHLEHCYPGSRRKKCDLVLQYASNTQFWIEVKNAWKRWYRCDGTIGSSSAFKGYLLGDASHPGTAHDFERLEAVAKSENAWVGVLLIGFDSVSAPMDGNVLDLVSGENLLQRGWIYHTHASWPDRRNHDFRLNCWFWARHPTFVA